LSLFVYAVAVSSDGRIEFPEWRGVLAILRPDLSEPHAQVIFKVLDANKTGYIDELEFRRVVDAYGMRFTAVIRE